jgi:hypothetical protein
MKGNAMQAIEKKIATAIVEAALAKGWTIGVYDGEEWALKRSSSKDEIIKALASTDEDVLTIRDAGGEAMGSIYLVWGNGEDLVSDHSVDLTYLINPILKAEGVL